MNRADNNQNEIVKALRKCGASVHILSQVGNGCPDLAVGFRGENFFLEVKEPGGMLRATQLKWHQAWNGQVAVVHDFEEAWRAINKTL